MKNFLILCQIASKLNQFLMIAVVVTDTRINHFVTYLSVLPLCSLFSLLTNPQRSPCNNSYHLITLSGKRNTLKE